MNDLRSFVILQARLYQFLEQQDDTTLQAIVSGTAQLAVVGADNAQAPVSSIPRDDVRIASRPAPSSDPLQVAHDLSRLASEQERRIYLNAADLPVKGLRKVAKLRDLAGYSRLTRAELIRLLAGNGPDQTDASASEPRTPAPSTAYPADSDSDAQQRTTAQEASPSTAAPSTDTAKPGADVAAIASHLREIETEDEGAAYLRAQHLDRESLLAVAAALQLTRVDRLSQTELEKRVLKQAIGARRKFAGLRRW